MDDLIEFLRERLDDDERAAREAPGQEWTVGYKLAGPPGIGRLLQGIDTWLVSLPNEDDAVVAGPTVAAADGDTRASRWAVEHIARYDPARVLAEVDAKRRIIDWALDDAKGGQDAYPPDEIVDVIRGRALTPVLKLLALPYADHADYRPEWRP